MSLLHFLEVLFGISQSLLNDPAEKPHPSIIKMQAHKANIYSAISLAAYTQPNPSGQGVLN